MVFIMINTLIQSLNFYSYHNYNGSNCSNSQQYLYKFNVKLTFESNQLITNHMNLLMPKCRFLTSFLDEKSFKTSLRSMLSKMALWTRGNALWFRRCWLKQFLRYVFRHLKTKNMQTVPKQICTNYNNNRNWRLGITLIGRQ